MAISVVTLPDNVGNEVIFPVGGWEWHIDPPAWVLPATEGLEHPTPTALHNEDE